MKPFFVAVAILGSPVWISACILAIPRRGWLADVLLCGLQAAIAFSLWWFFWGDGIGRESHLAPAWQWLGLLAFLPVLSLVLKRWLRRAPTELSGFPVVQNGEDESATP